MLPHIAGGAVTLSPGQLPGMVVTTTRPLFSQSCGAYGVCVPRVSQGKSEHLPAFQRKLQNPFEEEKIHPLS